MQTHLLYYGLATNGGNQALSKQAPNAAKGDWIVTRRRIVNVPELKDRMRVHGVVLKSSTPEEFAKMMADDVATYSKLVKAAGIKVD